MSEEPKKVSRRQAIKLLTATAGAATMANLPNKWVKPVLNAGVLPAHAQTSPVDPATATSTPTNTPTSTPTNTPTSTPTNTPTSTPTDTPTYSLSSCLAYVEEMDGPLPYPWDIVITSAEISPVAAGINMQRTIYVNNVAHPSYTTPFVTTGVTDGTGSWNPTDFDLSQLHDQQDPPGIWGEFVIVLWEVVAPDVGVGTCQNTLEIVNPQ